VAPHGHPRRTHPGPQPQGQLLEHGRARPRRPLLRDLHRPRPRVRPRRRPGRRRGPLPRDLEPRLPAGGPVGRPRQGRLRHPRPVAQQEHRHGRRPGAHRVPAPGQAQHVRDRRDLPRHRARRRAGGHALRRRSGRRRAAPRRGRPCPQRAHAHDRRRGARQRGARLRAAPAAAAQHPVDAPARRARPGAARAAAAEPRTDGRVLPRGRRALGAGEPGGLRRGGVLPADAGRRHPDLRPGRRSGPRGAQHRDQRGAGVPPARHLRLPDRPDPGDGFRAGAQRRPGTLRRTHDRAAAARQGRRPRQEGRRGRHRGLPSAARRG